jgi:hypothetical protein
MSQQYLMELLLYVLCGFVIFFILVIIFIEIKYSPENSFYLEPLVKGFIKILKFYLIFCIIAVIIFNIFF